MPSFFHGSLWVLFGLITHLALFCGVALHLLRHRRRTDSTLLWLLLTGSAPLLGAILYAMFGVDRVPRERWISTNSRRADMSLNGSHAPASEITPDIYWRRVLAHPAQPPDEWTRSLDAPYAAMTQNFPLLAHNQIAPLITGDEAFPKMLAAIRAARDHIHLQTFIIGNDPIGREFLSALAERARAGVRVRFLYDRFGSSHALFSPLFNPVRTIPGFSLAGWTQANLFRRQLHYNLRNHRKILVVDGAIGFTGGINLSQSEASLPGAPAIQDYHFLLQGPIVQELQYAFLRDWHVMTEEDPARLLLPRYFPEPAHPGNAYARVLLAGPSSDLRVAVDVFFNALCQARHEVLIITPYFIPSEDLLRALRQAAMRGVTVRLILPQRSNHWYTTWAARALYEDLIEAGVHIHERRPPFIHAKAMIVDDRLAIIGSANWDIRSLYSNYEILLTVYDAPFITALHLMMNEDLRQSDEIHLAHFKARPIRERYLENICGLLSPLL